jgi:hypothetical protein
MTFTQFLENISQQTLVETIHIGKAAVKEILYELRKKNVPEKTIQDWINVEFKKVKKPKINDVTQAYQMGQKKSTTHARNMSSTKVGCL